MSHNSLKKFFSKKKDWSLIKDALLGCYLVPYYTKIFYTKKKIIFIDGFAGKGKFDDGQPGSPKIAYDIATQIAEKNNLNKNMYEFIFIENKYGDDLEKNFKDIDNTKVIKGNYQDNVLNVLESQIGSNIFLYVDPFGIKNIYFEIFKKVGEMKANSVEILLNLNSFGFIREACKIMKVQYDIPVEDDEEIEEETGYQCDTIEYMNSIAGGDYWQKIIEDYKNGDIDGYEAECQFSKQYCNNFKSKTNFKYAINLPIRTKVGNRPKYRMFFATNHLDGILIMNDSMAKRWDENNLKINNGCQSLFKENSENEIINESDFSNLIISILKENNKTLDINELIVEIISIIGIYKSSEIKKIIKSLEQQKVINIIRNPKITEKGKLSTFLTSDKDKKTTIILI